MMNMYSNREITDTCEDAFKRILRILRASDQAKSNIRAKLARVGYSQGSIDKAIDQACLYGLINDERYAELYVRSKLKAGKGRQGIIADLAKLHISQDILNDDTKVMLFKAEEDDELTRAVNLLNRKPCHSKHIQNSAFSKLVRNGYSVQIARLAAREWVEQNAC